MKATALTLGCTLFLAGCGSSDPPVVLSGSQSDYFGSWEHAGSEYGNNIVTDNMLLIVHPDSTVSYKRCINRANGHSYTSFGEATIKRLTDKELVISAGLWKLRWTKTFPINRTPYVEADDRYLEVDGQKLRRLKVGEPSTHESWKCSADED
jgi:hypothetical protein